MVRLVLPFALASLFWGSAALAEERGFTVAFTDCSEFAGWGPVSLAQAAPLVPPGYMISGATSGQASIVVRATKCAAAQVAGTPALPTVLSQIGINLISPDGTGTINNYTLVYITNNPFLAQAFNLVGVPAILDPGIVYEYTLNNAATGGTLYAAAPSPDFPAYFLYGTETEPPPNSAELFIANWWYAPHAQIKQSTTFPAISFGTAAVTFYTSLNSELGKLIGGNADNNFPYLSLRGEYSHAEMTVTVATAR